MLKYYRTIIALSIIPQFLLIKLLSNYPEFVETFYSKGLYVYISKALRFVFGWIPFSVGDLLYTIAIVYALRWLYKNRKRIVNDTLYWFRDILLAVSLLYFAFHFFWGLNYYRLPLHKSLGLKNDYTTEQLIKVTEKLMEKSNMVHAQISESDTIKVTMPFSKRDLLKNSSEGYEKLRSTYPQLHPMPKSIKRSVYSLPSSYMGIGGYLNPFTNEGQINSKSPLHRFPNTICHEQAHQIGFAAENESNFIGCLAAMNHSNPFFQYSGYIFALKYCLMELQRRDETVYQDFVERLHIGIRKNYQEEYEFWLDHQNPFRPLFDSTFNQFLKANNQPRGLESYSYVVALLVNHFLDS